MHRYLGPDFELAIYFGAGIASDLPRFVTFTLGDGDGGVGDFDHRAGYLIRLRLRCGIRADGEEGSAHRCG